MTPLASLLLSHVLPLPTLLRSVKRPRSWVVKMCRCSGPALCRPLMGPGCTCHFFPRRPSSRAPEGCGGGRAVKGSKLSRLRPFESAAGLCYGLLQLVRGWHLLEAGLLGVRRGGRSGLSCTCLGTVALTLQGATALCYASRDVPHFAPCFERPSRPG